MRLYEFEHNPAVLYHGTKYVDRAKSILKNGIRAQSDESMGRAPRGALTPVQGHSYLTPSLKYACIYAIGGNMVGTDYRGREGDDRYGYVFVVDRADLDLQPDEDEVGHAVREAPSIIKFHRENPGQVMHTRHMDNLVFGQALCDDPRLATELKWLADSLLTDGQKDKLWRDYRYDILAQAGKKLLKKMSPQMKARLVNLGCHVSTPQIVYPREAWRIDKRLNNKLGFQAEHFFEVAKRIA